MGALLSVAQGSVQPPKLIVLRYRADRRRKQALGLLGKGITFDSGGISIKPAGGMEAMKGDMSGGAAVIAAMWAIGQLKPPDQRHRRRARHREHALGQRQPPGDVVRAMSGKTIEIINTDAEGRLILADAIGYARQQGLSPIIDVATLTGAMVVALGKVATGCVTNDQALCQKVIARRRGRGREVLADAPLRGVQGADQEQRGRREEHGRSGQAGALTAAQFLAEFVEDTPWVHLDMAGTDDTDKEKGVWVKGATGIPTRTLVNLVLSLARSPCPPSGVAAADLSARVRGRGPARAMNLSTSSAGSDMICSVPRALSSTDIPMITSLFSASRMVTKSYGPRTAYWATILPPIAVNSLLTSRCAPAGLLIVLRPCSVRLVSVT